MPYIYAVVLTPIETVVRVDVHVYNSGWAFCFEGVRIGKKFQPLIFQIKGIVVLRIIKNIPKLYYEKRDHICLGGVSVYCLFIQT